MLTQKEIAELAGVSRVTVSRVLSGTAPVNAATREKVLQVIKMSGYEINKSARALVNNKKNHRIACFYILTDDLFYRNQHEAYLRAIEKYKGFGMDIELHNSSIDVEERFRDLRSIDCEQIHGIIISPLGISAEEIEEIRKISRMGIPVITMHAYQPELMPLSRVSNDSILSGEVAANLMELRNSDQTNVAVLIGFNTPAHVDRLRGVEKYIAKHKNMKLVEWAYHSDDAVQGFVQTQRLLTEHPEINALFVASGNSSGACRAVIEMGRVGSVHVVTVDKRPGTYEFMEQGIVTATIDQQEKIQVEHAVELLYRYLFYHEIPPKEDIVPVQVLLQSNYEQ